MESIHPRIFLKNMLMDTQQLLAASVLDIIFEGRNKEYGAYTLRKDYNKRLKIAMSVTGFIVLAFIILSSLKQEEQEIHFLSENIICTITPISPEEEPEPIPPTKPVEPPPPLKTFVFTSPRIVKDSDVPPEEIPPPVDHLINAKVDVFRSEGMNVDASHVPPVGTREGIIGNVSESKKPEDSIFVRVEIQSTYPGGVNAWARFLNKTLKYPDEAILGEIQGTVVVKFIVDTDGTVSNVQVVSGPEELVTEAIRVIKKSGKWTPAIQNGRTVKSYKQQPLVFRLSSE